MHIAHFKHVKTRYFFAFCLLEEICILLRGDKAILELIVNCVINMLLHVRINEVTQIFYCRFSRYLRV